MSAPRIRWVPSMSKAPSWRSMNLAGPSVGAGAPHGGASVCRSMNVFHVP